MPSGLTTVLIASAVVGGLAGALAALLLLAQKYLADYGTCVIDVNAGRKRIEVTGGDTLLNSLMGQGVFIPSACGGRGTCAYCKVRTLEGGGPAGPTEAAMLTAEEIARSVRISCQVKVRGDVRIEIPEQLLSVRQHRGTVDRIRSLTHDIRELRIRLIEPGTIDFVPGQYIQLQAPAYGDKRSPNAEKRVWSLNPEPVYRAYSIASPPGVNDRIELIIRLVPGGICTTWVFEILKEGDEVLFNGPYGDFRLSDGDEEMIWIAGGSGMAPFWSILRHMKAHNIARPCTYFFGAVQKRDVFLMDELRQLEKELPWFRYVPALSAPAEGDGWDGETGLITEVVDRHLTEPAGKEAYLCGSGGMIRAATKLLTAKGLPAERIYYDEFT